MLTCAVCVHELSNLCRKSGLSAGLRGISYWLALLLHCINISPFVADAQEDVIETPAPRKSDRTICILKQERYASRS